MKLVNALNNESGQGDIDGYKFESWLELWFGCNSGHHDGSGFAKSFSNELTNGSGYGFGCGSCDSENKGSGHGGGDCNLYKRYPDHFGYGDGDGSAFDASQGYSKNNNYVSRIIYCEK